MMGNLEAGAVVVVVVSGVRVRKSLLIKYKILTSFLIPIPSPSRKTHV